MATIHIRGKTRDGEFVHEISVPDSRVADVVSAVVGALHGSGVEASRRGGNRPVHQPERKFKTVPPRKFMTDEEAVAVYNKVPSVEDARQYILKQSERAHSLAQVAREFLGNPPSAQSTTKVEKRAFFLLQDRLSDARRRIAREDRSGSFIRDKTKVGASRVYRWKRN